MINTKRKIVVCQDPGHKDIGQADFYGELIFLDLPDVDSESVDLVSSALYKELNRINFTHNDYILMLGDPAVLSMALTIAASRTAGVAKILKYNRLRQKYFAVTIDLNNITKGV
jgi:hypothetical protein